MSDPDRCVGCGAVVDEHGCAGICKGCLQPERLEAILSELPKEISNVMTNVGQDFGILPR